VSYDDSKAVDEIVGRYSTDRPVIGECRLKVLKYQPPNLPAGKTSSRELSRHLFILAANDLWDVG